ncbi:MAG TPA: glucose-1-phosphate adenylyltransferase [Methylomusa anaerophila]|uniref:Glucose-1-phosphate adenylyltransferase n=1 Tax=Methylomusa anaerophila TaxID=1930071 RepID=A0A348AH38_9FIRM|nr:glucose-1-phosphate adenylyltransferase [Methylomusa anaerophila]BBB90386.1 glucose-1-phosphate adenylyltransferase [Methylomusa anaerophila]HML89267.1 glucose-1-phosphate adenylyltransferase [Methylomusa anaerophila]
MRSKECIAMILAGGQGSRLSLLTQRLAKPAVPFGGKYRIIDFSLSNCRNSGIDTIGVLTQYQPLTLNSYIGIGSAWDLDRQNGGVFVLPPYTKENKGEWYKGTADAIYQNMNFIDRYNASYVVVLSGDHIYKMDYSLMLDYHKNKNSEATIAVSQVPWDEAGRFGIMNTDGRRRITEFEEKPKNPKSNLASMGVYIFNWSVLRRYLEDDARDILSNHDFGRNIIPEMLAGRCNLYAYAFNGYWKDVGTVDSYWEANMDLLAETPGLNLYDADWKIYSVDADQPPQYLAPGARVTRSIIADGCMVYGQVDHSILFPGAYVGPGAQIKNSVIMPYVQIGEMAVVNHAVIGRKTVLEPGVMVTGDELGAEVLLVGENLLISRNFRAAKTTAVNEGRESWEYTESQEMAVS